MIFVLKISVTSQDPQFKQCVRYECQIPQEKKIGEEVTRTGQDVQDD